MDRRSFLKGLLVTVAVPALPSIPVSLGAFETTFVDTHLIRAAIWNRQIKEMLLEDLSAMKFSNVFEEEGCASATGT